MGPNAFWYSFFQCSFICTRQDVVIYVVNNTSSGNDSFYNSLILIDKFCLKTWKFLAIQQCGINTNGGCHFYESSWSATGCHRSGCPSGIISIPDISGGLPIGRV